MLIVECSLLRVEFYVISVECKEIPLQRGNVIKQGNCRGTDCTSEEQKTPKITGAHTRFNKRKPRNDIFTM